MSSPMAAVALTLLVLLLHAATAFGASPVASTVGRLALLTVFGDSNSDAGNAAYAKRTFYNPNLNWPIGTYYTQGRFSNGPIWTDFVNDECTSLEVKGYAVGFGTHCTANAVASLLLASNPFTAPLTRLFPPVVSVEQQAAAYISTDLQVNNLPAKRGVYIWAAANDLSAIYFSDPQAPYGAVTKLSEAAIRATAACAANTVRTLYAAGERTFILANLQPLDKSAFITQLVAVGMYYKIPGAENLPRRIANYVASFNTYLRAEVSNLRTQFPDARIYYHNIYRPLNVFLSGLRPELGFENLRNACINFESTQGFQSLNTSQVAILAGQPPANAMNAVASVCPEPSKFADWDVNHFTTRAHKEVLAKEIVKFLKIKGLLCDTGC